MAAKKGWRGRVYEDFEVGDTYDHAVGRTLTETDNTWFTLLTVNTNPIHFDRAFAARTEFGRPLVDSTLTLALVTGLTVSDLSQNAVNLGWDEVRLLHPVFAEDTLYARSEVLSKRRSKSRPTMGVVTFRTEGFNQDGASVIEFERTILVFRRGHVPHVPRPAPPRGKARTSAAAGMRNKKEAG